MGKRKDHQPKWPFGITFLTILAILAMIAMIRRKSDFCVVSLDKRDFSVWSAPCSTLDPIFIDLGFDTSDRSVGKDWIIVKPHHHPTNVDEGGDRKKESDNDTKVERLYGEEEIRRIKKILHDLECKEPWRDQKNQEDAYAILYLCVAAAFFLLGVLLGEARHGFSLWKSATFKNRLTLLDLG